METSSYGFLCVCAIVHVYSDVTMVIEPIEIKFIIKASKRSLFFTDFLLQMK